MVTYPWWISRKMAERFVLSQNEWIKRNFSKLRSRKGLLNWGGKKEYRRYKKQACRLVEEKLDYFNTFYGFEYKRFSIRNQRTLWGSCSSKKNLNFNFRIVFLPGRLQDYLVVHELCHLKQMNHSPEFWELVSRQVGDYKNIKKQLKQV